LRVCERANTHVSACECAYTGDSTIRAKPCSPDAFSLFYDEHFFFIYILYTDVFFVYYFRDTPFSLFLQFLFSFLPSLTFDYLYIYIWVSNTKCVHIQYSAVHDGVQISSTSEKAKELFPKNSLRWLHQIWHSLIMELFNIFLFLKF